MLLRTMGQAAVTMNQLQKQMDMVGNNIANSSTPGFKTRQAEFSSLLFQHMQNFTDPENSRGRLTPDGIRLGTGAKLGAIHSNMNLGAQQNTDRDLDVALLNEYHFFQIQVEENGTEEVRFTRDGSFYLQPMNNGNDVALVTKNGHPVGGENGRIQFSSTGVESIQIEADGTIMVQRENGQSEFVGRLSIAEINRPRLMESVGENQYRLSNLDELGIALQDIVQEVPQANHLVKNRTLEMSNVNIADEMTNLINAQRSYQYNARTISMEDQMQGLINQMR